MRHAAIFSSTTRVLTIIDNLLHPILVGNRLELHTVLAFIAVVGGLILFGDRGMAALLAFRVSSWIHRPAAALLADPASKIAWLRRPHSGSKDVADSQSVAFNQPRHSTRKFMISNDTQKSMLESSFRARRRRHSIRHMCGWNWLAVGLFLGVVPSFIAGTLPDPTPPSRGCEPVVASELQRGPQGARDSRVLRIASELGYVSIYWTLDSLDSVAPQKSRAPFLSSESLTTRRRCRRFSGVCSVADLNWLPSPSCSAPLQ